MRGLLPSVVLGLFASVAAVPSPTAAQLVDYAPSPRLAHALGDRLRRDQLVGRAALDDFLTRRSTASLDAWVGNTRGAEWRVHLLTPRFETIWNSQLPFSFNDGSLWAGRGSNTRLVSGFRLQRGLLTITFAPEYVYSENLPFQTIAYPPAADPPRSRWAHPYHPLPESLDWPIRFGDEPLESLGMGQSSVTLDAGPLRVGLSTENVWWGPGIFNGLLLSAQGPGFPHAYLATARPFATPAGEVEATWLLGRLTESDFFDFDPSNDHRTLSGAAVTLRTQFDPGLTLGLARIVVAPLSAGETVRGAAFDFLKAVGQPNSARPDSTVAPGPDQITGVFFRWTFPPAGFEVYAEWARFEEPVSFMDFLEFPMHSQGFTVGLEWIDERASGTWLGVQVEYTNLEPATTFRFRRVYTHYSSRSVIQGFTHEGQMLGAAIGPGSSGQWLAIDHGWGQKTQVGFFAGRIRKDNAVLFTEIVPDPKREDVTLFTGLRGGIELGGWSVHAEFSRSIRLNYLFQSFPFDPVTGAAEGVDIPNSSVTLTLSRALRRAPAAN